MTGVVASRLETTMGEAMLTDEQLHLIAAETLASAPELHTALLSMEEPFSAADMIAAVLAARADEPPRRARRFRWLSG